MTIPSERFQAILNAEEFLLSLLDPSKTPRVPKEIRRRAALVLRHYPSRLYVELIADLAPKYLKDIDTFSIPKE